MPTFFTESVTGLQVGPSLALRTGVVLFLALCIVELIVFAQVCVCVRASDRALVGGCVRLRCDLGADWSEHSSSAAVRDEAIHQ